MRGSSAAVIAGSSAWAGATPFSSAFVKAVADVARERVGAGQRLVGALEDDHVAACRRSASTKAASGKGRSTLTWIEPTFAPRVARRWSTAASMFSAAEPSETKTVSASSQRYCG